MLKDFEIKKAISVFLLYKTNSFYVAVRLLRNRSQKTSRCGKNISDTPGYRIVCHSFLPHFDVICDLLQTRRTATWNLFVKYFFRKLRMLKNILFSYIFFLFQCIDRMIFIRFNLLQSKSTKVRNGERRTANA